MSAFDRGKARGDLELMGVPVTELMLDRLERCVRPTPPVGIDRDKLIDALNEPMPYVMHGRSHVDVLADRIIVLVRPVDGIVLNPEEAQRVISGLRWAALHPTDGAPDTWGTAWITLAARLEVVS